MRYLSLLLLNTMVFGQQIKTNKNYLEMEYKYRPLILESYVKKEDLGKILKQDVMLYDIPSDKNFTWEISKFKRLERTMPSELFKKVDISDKVYFDKDSSLIERKNNNLLYPIFFDTKKDFKGCYYFNYKIVPTNNIKDTKKQEKSGLKALATHNFKLVSSSFVKVRDTEPYTVNHDLNFNWGQSLNLDYSIEITSSCIVKYPRIHFDIFEDDKKVYQSNKTILSESGNERTLYPYEKSHYKTSVDLSNIKYKRNKKYKIIFFVYSNDSNFNDFFISKEFELKK